MKVKCWICGGRGHIPVYELFCDQVTTARGCTNCKGTGVVELEIIPDKSDKTGTFMNKFVIVTIENELELMQTLEALGCLWSDGRRPTEFLPVTQGTSWDSRAPINILPSEKRPHIVPLLSKRGLSVPTEEITLEELRGFVRRFRGEE